MTAASTDEDLNWQRTLNPCFQCLHKLILHKQTSKEQGLHRNTHSPLSCLLLLRPVRPWDVAITKKRIMPQRSKLFWDIPKTMLTNCCSFLNTILHHANDCTGVFGSFRWLVGLMHKHRVPKLWLNGVWETISFQKFLWNITFIHGVADCGEFQTQWSNGHQMFTLKKFLISLH